MSNTRSNRFGQALKKLVVSAFVILTFVAYAINDRLNSSDVVVAIAPTLSSETRQTQGQPSPTVIVLPTNVPASPGAIAALPSPTLAIASPSVSSVMNVKPPTAVPATAVPPTATNVIVLPTTASGYKDGQYTGSIADAFYGKVQVKTTIQAGKITDVQFLNYPQSRNTSVRINARAMPVLRTEAIQAQNSQVNIISGATLTSRAFMQSLQSALNQAKA